MHHPTPDFVELKDGRRLAYVTYGDPEGVPLLFLHGTPGTSMQIGMASEGARKLGFKLIAPDRPGLGDSDVQAERMLYHYPLDVVQLLDYLKIRQCPVIAISGGAPYAFQCAHDLPERLTHIVSLSGWINYGRPEVRDIRLDSKLHVLDKICRHGARLLPTMGRVANWVVKNRLDDVYKHLLKMLPPADITLLQQKDYKEILLEDMRHAYRQGWEGVKLETQIQFSQPAFRYENIIQPTYLLHGTADTIVPFAFSEYLHLTLPKVVGFEVVKEGGHLCAISEQENIFKAVHGMLREMAG
jgi:pimeloyl-ACP methyl ester carboxylesterase